MTIHKGSKRYQERLKALQQRYGRKTVQVSVRIPEKLHREWKAYRNNGRRVFLSEIVSVALNFGLFGAHPYNDPIEGLVDAFEFYEERNLSHNIRFAKMLETVCRGLGFQVKIEPY